jgi:2-furoate---CoA ligase
VRDLGSTLIAVSEREPNAIAVVDGERRKTWQQWLDNICRVVSALDELRLVRGDHLVSVLQNRYEAATLHWACQLAGIIITPLNWRAPTEEVAYVLADAHARAVAYEPVSADAVRTAHGDCAMPTIAVAGATGATHDFKDLLTCKRAPLMSRAADDDVSVMLYTSGTTGRGKGVARTHRAERTAALAHVAQNQYRYGERTLGVMPLYHTMGVRSLLAMALINGRFVCQPRFDATTAIELIESEGVTNLYLVPTLYHDLLAQPGFTPAKVASVTKLGFAGAPMTDGLLQRCQAAFAPELFVNHYGSSEIYTFTVCPNAVAKPGSAGKAGINQRIRVVALGSDSPHQQVDTAQEGQIIASLDSDEAFTGYWRRPDADAKSLHDGWYFTGDIGYRDADGDLFVTGRIDDMIISAGENILPAEIESVLSLHDAVLEVAVAGRPHERLGQQVTAFVRTAAVVDAETLDAWCQQSDLAAFKRPREYVFVKAIPKSPVGKILRRMLIAGDYEC